MEAANVICFTTKSNTIKSDCDNMRHVPSLVIKTCFFIVLLAAFGVSSVAAQDVPEARASNPGGFQSLLAHDGSVEALQEPLSVHFEGVTLADALAEIASKSGLGLSYSPDTVPVDRLISLQIEEASVAEVLEAVVANTSLKVLVTEGGEIVIVEGVAETTGSDLIAISHRAAASPLQLSQLKKLVPAMQHEVSGTVTDVENGEPLPGVNVVVQGTTTGTTTDAEGRYELTVPDDDVVLVFSSVGFLAQEIAVEGRSEIDVSLHEDVAGLGELVVVGYGTQQRADLTGAVSSIESEAIESRPASNLTSLLQGISPGVTITQNSGRPGREGHSILIRGVGTMNNSSPMVIVDGVESSMDNVNPDDVESVSVLKDASSAAIYGSRAANGVILIRTKRGNAGTLNVNYKTYIGTDQATRLPEYVSSADYARLLNEANRNEGLDPRYSQEEIALFESGEDPYNYPNTSWLDLLLQGSGFTQNHSLSFSGGSEATQYRISLGYNQQNGLMEKTNSDRYNLRLNLDSEVSEWFDIGLNTAISRTNVSNPSNPYDSGGSIFQFFRQANRIPPVVANTYADGSWDRHDDGNPIAWVEEAGMYNSEASHVVGTVFAEAEIMEGLSLRGNASGDYSLTDSKHHFRTIQYGDESVQGPNRVTDSVNRNSIITVESILEYVNDFGPHGVNALAGVSNRYENYRALSGYRQNFPSNQISELTAGSQNGWENDGWASEDKLASFFGRIDYNFDNRYLFQANIRRDGSSKFAPGQRWGWFPSFSAGWRITEESFLDDLSWLTEFKIRASWGQLGNNRIGNYQYIPLISLGRNYNFGGTVSSGAAQTSPANEDITWETTTETNVGVDAAFLQGRLSLVLDYYNRYTDDILTSVPVSDLYGLPAPTVNAGAMRNEGVEIELGLNNAFRDLQYNLTLHGTYNKNEVERYDNPSYGTSIRDVGVPWDSYYGYEAIGQFQSQGDIDSSPHVSGRTPNVGDLKYRDQNGDGVIDGDDRVVLGNTIPEITFGLTLGGAYQGFDVSMFFQGADRVFRTIHPEAMWPFQNGAKVQDMHMDRTIVEDGEIIQQGRYPRVYTTATSGHTTSHYHFSSFSVMDASYIRMKNLQIGYTLSESWLPASNVRVYFSGENLFTITSFPGGYDPETPNGVGYPQIKTYTLGLNITF